MREDWKDDPDAIMPWSVFWVIIILLIVFGDKLDHLFF